jgi:hypothetical protein
MVPKCSGYKCLFSVVSTWVQILQESYLHHKSYLFISLILRSLYHWEGAEVGYLVRSCKRSHKWLTCIICSKFLNFFVCHTDRTNLASLCKFVFFDVTNSLDLFQHQSWRLRDNGALKVLPPWLLHRKWWTGHLLNDWHLPPACHVKFRLWRLQNISRSNGNVDFDSGKTTSHQGRGRWLLECLTSW